MPIAAVVVIAAYVGAQMLANIASLKIGIMFALAVDMGTFIYPITFTLRDVAHKILGKRAVRWLVIMAAVVNLFAALYMWWVTTVPSDPSWGLGAQWAQVFNPALLWRIVLASILAQVVSELVDTEVYHWFVTRVTRKQQWARVLVSNSVSVPVDNLIFAIGAFRVDPAVERCLADLSLQPDPQIRRDAHQPAADLRLPRPCLLRGPITATCDTEVTEGTEEHREHATAGCRVSDSATVPLPGILLLQFSVFLCSLCDLCVAGQLFPARARMRWAERRTGMSTILPAKVKAPLPSRWCWAKLSTSCCAWATSAGVGVKAAFATATCAG